MEHYFQNVYAALESLQARDRDDFENRRCARARAEHEDTRKLIFCEAAIKGTAKEIADLHKVGKHLTLELQAARDHVAGLVQQKANSNASTEQHKQLAHTLKLQTRIHDKESEDPKLPLFFTPGGGKISLPQSVLLAIFSFVPLVDVARCHAVCTVWETSINRSQLWRQNEKRMYLLSKNVKTRHLQTNELLNTLLSKSFTDAKNHHDHFQLTIELGSDSYNIMVDVKRLLNADCVPKSISATPESVGNSVIITICTQYPSNFHEEMTFCLAAIEFHMKRTQAQIDKATLLSSLDRDEGKKVMLTQQLRVVADQTELTKRQITDVAMQYKSDECTKEFLTQTLGELRDQVQQVEDDQDALRIELEADLDKKKVVWAGLKASESKRTEEVSTLKAHKTLLGKEFKQLKTQVEHLSKERDAAEQQFLKLKQAVDKLHMAH